MLILTRRIGESLIFGDNDVAVTILGIQGGQIRIGVNAPKEMSVHREEIYKKIKREEQLDATQRYCTTEECEQEISKKMFEVSSSMTPKILTNSIPKTSLISKTSAEIMTHLTPKKPTKRNLKDRFYAEDED